MIKDSDQSSFQTIKAIEKCICAIPNPLILFKINSDNTFFVEKINRSAEKILKVKSSDIIGFDINNSFNADLNTTQGIEKNMKYVLETGEIIQYEIYLSTPDSRKKKFFILNIAKLDEETVIASIITHEKLVHSKKLDEAEEALRKSNAFNLSLSEYAPVGIMYLDNVGRISSANPVATGFKLLSRKS